MNAPAKIPTTPVTFDAQMVALMETHRLQSIGVSIIRLDDGTMFWVANAQADGLCWQGEIARTTGASAAIQSAIDGLNAKRVVAADVPELEALA